MEVINIPETKAHELTMEEKVPVINNLLGKEVLQLIQTFTFEEKEKCTTEKGLFTVLCSTIKLQHNRIIISLQYLKLHRKSNESA